MNEVSIGKEEVTKYNFIKLCNQVLRIRGQLKSVNVLQTSESQIIGHILVPVLLDSFIN